MLRFALLFCAALLAGNVQAADLPDRPIRIIVPFTPAGTSDILAPVLAAAPAPLRPPGSGIDNRGAAGGKIRLADTPLGASPGCPPAHRPPGLPSSIANLECVWLDSRGGVCTRDAGGA